MKKAEGSFTWIHIEFEFLEPVGHRGPMAARTARYAAEQPGFSNNVFLGSAGAVQALERSGAHWHLIDDTLSNICASNFLPKDLVTVCDDIAATVERFLCEGDDVVIFLPMPDPAGLLATAMAVQKVCSANLQPNSRLLVCARLGMPDARSGRHSLKQSNVLKLLNTLHQYETNWLITAETPELCEEIAQTSGLKVETQGPALPRILAAKKEHWTGHLSSRTPRLSYLGEARREKGFEYLPAIFTELKNQGFPFHGLVHGFANPENRSSGISDAKEKLLTLSATLPQSSQLKLLTSPISEVAYTNALLATDLVLLPYDKTTYQARGSGVLDECLEAGVIALISRDNPLYQNYQHHDLVQPFDLKRATESVRAALSARSESEPTANKTGRFFEPIFEGLQHASIINVTDDVQSGWIDAAANLKDWEAMQSWIDQR